MVKSSEGWVFGGYASESWNCLGRFFGSSACFLFTLTNQIPFPGTNPLYGSNSYGPSFGSGFDLKISDYSNNNNLSYSRLSCSYADTTGKGHETFTGTKQFICQDIEVYLMN